MVSSNRNPDRRQGGDQRVAFLTMEDTSGWSIDADLAFAPLASLGWQAQWLPWRQAGVDWSKFDAVYPAATWDYPEHAAEFLGVLEVIELSTAVLVNPLPLLRWNIPKTYLRSLEKGGVRIVPSRFYERFADCDLAVDFEHFAASQLIVKPVIGANAQDAFLLGPGDLRDVENRLEILFGDRAFIVQPYLAQVAREGEYSLFWIGSEFSHAIRKLPKASDFRVQEEHGATIEATELTAELLGAAERALQQVPARPLYARCDFVRDSAGHLCVMELELIEPSLYLRMHEGAPQRFASAFDNYIRHGEANRP